MDELDEKLFDLAYQEGKSVGECLYDVYQQGRVDERRKIIPDGATNGDIIKALFPLKKEPMREVSITHDKVTFSINDGSYFGIEMRVNTSWWNAPYQLTEQIKELGIW